MNGRPRFKPVLALALLSALGVLFGVWYGRSDSYGPARGHAERATEKDSIAGKGAGLRTPPGTTSLSGHARERVRQLIVRAVGAESGQPVPLAEIRLDREPAEPGSRRQIVSSVDGISEFELVEVGDYQLRVSARNYMSAVMPLRVDSASDSTPMHIEVPTIAASAVAVAVSAAPGTEIVGTRVTIECLPEFSHLLKRMHPADLMEFAQGRVRERGLDGLWRFPCVPPGVPFKFVGVSASGATGRALCEPLSPGEDSLVELALHPPTRITCRFPKAVLGASVRATAWLSRVVDEGRGRIGEAFADSDEDGVVRFTGVDGGWKAITGLVKDRDTATYFFGSGQAPGGESTDFGELRTGTRTMDLLIVADDNAVPAKLADVLIQIMPSGKPQSGVISVDESPAIHTVMTVGEPVRFIGLPEGTIYVKAAPLSEHMKLIDGLRAAAATIPADGSGRFVIRMPVLVPRQARVVRLTLEAPPGTSTALLRPRLALLSSDGLVLSATTTPMSEGTSTLSFPIVDDPKDPQLLVISNGYSVLFDVSSRISTGNEGIVARGDWREATPVDGMVVDSSGASVAGALVLVSVRDGSPEETLLQSIQEATTATDGSFRIAIPEAPQRLYVSARKPGLVSERPVPISHGVTGRLHIVLKLP